MEDWFLGIVCRRWEHWRDERGVTILGPHSGDVHTNPLCVGGMGMVALVTRVSQLRGAQVTAIAVCAYLSPMQMKCNLLSSVGAMFTVCYEAGPDFIKADTRSTYRSVSVFA